VGARAGSPSPADRFRRAFRSEPATAERLRREGEAILRELARVSTQAWPWYELGLREREEKALVPSKGPPLFAGMRFRVDKDLYEVGRLDGAIAAAGGVPLRKPGELGPQGIDLRESGMAEKLAELTPEALEVDWPALDTEREAWRRNAERANAYSEFWGDLAIRDLPDAVGEEVWPVFFAVAQGDYQWLRRRAELTHSYASARDALGGVFPVLLGGTARAGAVEGAVGAPGGRRGPPGADAERVVPVATGLGGREVPAESEAQGGRRAGGRAVLVGQDGQEQVKEGGTRLPVTDLEKFVVDRRTAITNAFSVPVERRCNGL
jgi:hypothetical protein